MAAEIKAAVLAGLGVALLRAKIDFAALTDVVAGVDLGLSRKASG
jgi:hypothetical protein